MKFIIGLATVLMIPLMLLNAFGGIVSGIWLAVIGEWGTIGYGVAFMIGGTILLGIPLLLGIVFAGPAIYFTNKGYNFLSYIFMFLGVLYTAAVITAWSMFILIYFVDDVSRSAFLPTLIWTYSVATAPLAYMGSKEPDNEYSGFTVFFNQFAYLCVVLLLSFVNNILVINVVMVFGAVMFLGAIVQLMIGIANTKAQQVY